MSRRILVLLAALPLLLAGCGGGADPAVVAKPTPSASATPAVESSAPPPAAETPEEFVRRWAQAEVDMENTGDADEYLALTPKCMSCGKLAKQIVGYYEAGGYVRFEGQTVTKVQEIERRGQRLILRVQIDAQRTEYKQSRDAEEQELAGGTTAVRMTIMQADRSWTLLQYIRLAS